MNTPSDPDWRYFDRRPMPGAPPGALDSPAPSAESADPRHDRPDDVSGGEAGRAADAESDALDDWKEELREDFEMWLADLDEIPESDERRDEDVDDAPDLYSFYEQLAGANAESRKANRRTAEVISQWGETLASFESSLGPLRETASQLAAVQPKEGRLSRAHCLALVELLDRIGRLALAFRSPPVTKKSWWGGNDDAWRQAWDAQRQALDILVGHIEALLEREGVTRIDTVERAFDPTVMMAVAAEPDATRPPQTVLEELAAGYRLNDELLRAAQVKVARKP